MVWNNQGDEKQGPTTKATLPSKAIIKNQRRNKELPIQEKATGVCQNQTSTATNVKGPTLRRRRRKKKEREKGK